MVFVIPEDRVNPANVAAQNLANMFSQRQGSTELQKALGIGGDINFANLSPEQQKLILANENIKKQQQQDQQLFDLIFGSGQPQQQAQNLPFQQGAGALPANIPLEQTLPEGVTPIAPPSVQSSNQITSQAAIRNNERGQERPRLTDRQVAGVSIKHPKVAQVLQSQNKADDARFKAVADRNWDVAKKVFEDSDKAAQGLVTKENALAIQKQAIEERGVGGFTKDLLADAFGSDLLRTAQGAAFTTAGKEFLLGNIKKAGARPNQWIEQQISKSLPKLGQTDEANKTVIEMLDLENRVQRKEIELIDEIADRQEREFGYVKRSLGSDVQKELKQYADQELKVTERRIRDIAAGEKANKREAQKSAPPQGQSRVRLPNGQTGFIPNEQLDAFIKAHNAEVVK